jgi:hypothetical protein
MHIIRSIDAYRFIEIAHGSNAHKGIWQNNNNNNNFLTIPLCCSKLFGTLVKLLPWTISKCFVINLPHEVICFARKIHIRMPYDNA